MPERRTLLAGAPAEESFGYSQGVTTGDFVAIAGQVGRDNATGVLDGPPLIGVRTKRALRNVRCVATELGGPDVAFAALQIHVDVDLREHLAEIAALHRRCYGEQCPAVSIVPLAGLSNPDYLIEISAMATHQPRTTLPDDGPIGRLFGSARAVRVGDDVFLGAHLPLGDDGEVAPGTVVDHLGLVCAGIERTLLELGGSLGDLVALHVFVAGAPTDEEWPPFAELHRRYFGPDKPASTLLYVPELPFGALVQISAVARIADAGA